MPSAKLQTGCRRKLSIAAAYTLADVVIVVLSATGRSIDASLSQASRHAYGIRRNVTTAISARSNRSREPKAVHKTQNLDAGGFRRTQRLPRLSTVTCLEPGRTLRSYLRAAQAYMLISMPTGTSTTFGVFQVIWFSQVMVQTSHRHQPRTAQRRTQVSACSPKVGSYFSRRSNARPAEVRNSFASSVPSPSRLAALKRFSTTARYSSSETLPS